VTDKRKSMRAILILTALGLLLIRPARATDILTPSLLYSRFVPAIDSFSRLDSLRERHRILGHRISIQAIVASPLKRYLAPTNYGYQDVTPSNSNMGFVVDIWKSKDFSWEFDFLFGGIVLNPYVPFEDANGNLINPYTPIYDLQFLMMNRMHFGGWLDTTLGLLHEQKSDISWSATSGTGTSGSATSGEQFFIQPGEATVNYSFNPLTDRWLFSTNLWQIAADVVVEGQLKNLRLGKSWNLPFLPSLEELFTGIMYNNYGSFFGTGPEIGFDYLSLVKGRLQVDLVPEILWGMVTGSGGTTSGGTSSGGTTGSSAGGTTDGAVIPLIVNAFLDARYTFLKKLTGGRLMLPLKAGVSFNYNGVRGSPWDPDAASVEAAGGKQEAFYFGWDISFGILINPPKENPFLSLMGFDLNLDVSMNYIPAMTLMPVYQSPIVTMYFGFHFF